MNIENLELDFDKGDPWAWAEDIVERIKTHAGWMARSEPEAHHAVAYAIFRAKTAQAMTRLLERIRELEAHLEGGLT